MNIWLKEDMFQDQGYVNSHSVSSVLNTTLQQVEYIQIHIRNAQNI